MYCLILKLVYPLKIFFGLSLLHDKFNYMLKKELEELFNSMPQIVQEKLQPVLENLLERADDLDNMKDKESDEYADEHELIIKEVNKVKYLNDQWQIMNARKNN